MKAAGSEHARVEVPWSGRFQAVVFDLFGTLVPVFDRTAHQAAIHDVAAILTLPFEDVERLWGDSYPARTAGEFPSVAANLEWIGDRLGRHLGADRVVAATTRYARFTREGLDPLPGVLETLAALTEPVGLLTNCAPDVPEELGRSPLAGAFDAAVYSGRDGVHKPDRAAFLAVADQLGIEPQQILYVGDGSDHELTGALAAGMHAVLVQTDLGLEPALCRYCASPYGHIDGVADGSTVNQIALAPAPCRCTRLMPLATRHSAGSRPSRTYDQIRSDVTDWTGPRIDRIPELLDYRPA